MRSKGVASVLAIEAKGLVKYYGRSKGIHNISLEVDQGEIFGFIGPNGAGKTTTIRILLNLIFPTGGSARILGLDCVKQSVEVRKRVGYLPGEISYYSDMTVRQLVEYSNSFYGKDCSTRQAELIDYLGINGNSAVGSLSLGNKKKVGIALALMHGPQLLILDEPTSGLDPLMQRKFYSLIQEENKRGTTVFLSSHVLAEVQKLCHRAAIIKGGSILGVEDIEAIKNKRLRRVRYTCSAENDSMAPQISGVFGLTQENGAVSFMYEGGNLPALLNHLAKLPLTDLAVEEPSLEEVFMHYYEGETVEHL